ncbi:MAG: TlpA family protein disulfide reductase, partial [Gammaproteobacteria bacterium]|nr:TlpA family protein disulfide reductase [Gammaproteobacteria bacterium]
PCRKEMPTLESLKQQMQGKNFKMILINTAEDEDTVFEFMAAVAPNLSTLLDKDGLATEAWQPRGLPATYLVDPQGKIQYQALGGRPWNNKSYLMFIQSLMSR